MRLLRFLIGTPAQPPAPMLDRYPELRQARWRRGGLPPRIGGWALGQRYVAAITLWRTIWLGDDVAWDAELLLHELRHVHQFAEDRSFPLRYVWRSLRHGYSRNPYETDARQFAASRAADGPPTV